MSNWDTSNWKVETLLQMVYTCHSLKSMKGTINASMVTSTSNTFGGCPSLTEVPVLNGLNISVSLAGTILSRDQATNFLEGLAEVEVARTVTFSAATSKSLSADDKAVATSKGWTVAG